MKKGYAFLLVFISIAFLCTAVKNELPQWREVSFKTVKIGKQIWTAENLNIPMPKSWYYDKDSLNNIKYGRLYYWSDAMAAVPRGWHIPSLDEWNELIRYCGGDSLAGGKLMEGGSTGLNLQLCGHKSANITTNDLFDMLGFKGFYWTSTKKGDQFAYAVVLTAKSWFVEKNFYRRANGFSVRLIKD